MGYVDSILQPDETVRHRGQLHWIVFARAGALALLAVAVITVAETSDQAVGTVIWMAAVVALLAFYVLVATFVELLTTEIAITTRRVIVKTGWIRRSTSEMNLAKVESVDVDQSVLGRMLNYGTVSVRGTGSGLNPIGPIASPLQLRGYIA
jgi:uncharacterized membrane protein YdbT with pleckstrin-like domain